MVKWGIEYEASDVDKAISSIRSGLDISVVTSSHMIQISKTEKTRQRLQSCPDVLGVLY